MAWSVRLAIALLAGLAAVLAFMTIEARWMALLAALVVFAVGSALAEAASRRLASADALRADLEDRVRNPP